MTDQELRDLFATMRTDVERDGVNVALANGSANYDRVGDESTTVVERIAAVDDVVRNDYKREILADLPVAFWRFDDTSNTVLADRSGYGNDGSLSSSGISRAEDGAVDDGTDAMRFNGVIGTRITVPGSPTLNAINGSTRISMEAWIRPETLTLANNFGIALCGNANDQNYLGINPSLTPKAFASYRIGGTQRTLTGGEVLRVNTWYHLVATYDGAYFRLYENGRDIGSMAVTGVIDWGTSGLLIGAHHTNGFEFTGRIDESEIYDRALTATEVADHYSYRK